MPQSFASILVHLVFTTKNRLPLLTPEIEPELHAYIAAVLQELDSPALEINGTADHLHILLRLSRVHSLAELVEEIKKRSSKWLKTKGAFWTDFHWQAGYGAFSIGESAVPALRRYIATQKAHHRTRSFPDEFRSLLQKYHVPYDERSLED